MTTKEAAYWIQGSVWTAAGLVLAGLSGYAFTIIAAFVFGAVYLFMATAEGRKP